LLHSAGHPYVIERILLALTSKSLLGGELTHRVRDFILLQHKGSSFQAFISLLNFISSVNFMWRIITSINNLESYKMGIDKYIKDGQFTPAFDVLVTKSMESWNVPGLSIAVIQDHEICAKV
jgi:hypothetical protein